MRRIVSVEHEKRGLGSPVGVRFCGMAGRSEIQRHTGRSHVKTGAQGRETRGRHTEGGHAKVPAGAGVRRRQTGASWITGSNQKLGGRTVRLLP